MCLLPSSLFCFSFIRVSSSFGNSSDKPETNKRVLGQFEKHVEHGKKNFKFDHTFDENKLVNIMSFYNIKYQNF